MGKEKSKANFHSLYPDEHQEQSIRAEGLRDQEVEKQINVFSCPGLRQQNQQDNPLWFSHPIPFRLVVFSFEL